MSRRSLWLIAALALSLPAFGLTTTSVSEGLTATDVASLLSGPGATITNVKITGSNLSIGSFDGAGDLGIDSGVVLSTGDIARSEGPNTATDTSGLMNTSGHPALDAIVTPYKTHDAVVIEFDVVTASPTFTIRYVFASEEYREWVGSEFNDVFGFFVNGSNIALTPGTATPVTVNTINHIANNGIYHDNEGGTTNSFDGYTVPLTAVGVVEPGVTNHIRIAIADASDDVLDSAVFIARGGISGSQIAPIMIPDKSAVQAAPVGDRLNVPLPLYYAFANNPPQFSASGLPGGTITFSPIFQGPDGRMYSNINIAIGPDTPSGSHVVTIRSTVGEAESFTTFIVVVDCKPPVTLGTGQPQNQTVDRGQSATLNVNATGSAPLTYQWYVGRTGMTRTPIAGATGPSLKTGAVTDATPYWVRVSNACGTYDSVTVFASPR